MQADMSREPGRQLSQARMSPAWVRYPTLRWALALPILAAVSPSTLAQSSLSAPFNMPYNQAGQLNQGAAGAATTPNQALTPAAKPGADQAAALAALGPTSPMTAQTAARHPGPVGAAPAPFGAQIFQGHFRAQSFTGFNPDYQIALGDRIAVRIWGATQIDQVLTVDAQGNIFVPQLGPVRVLGVRNAELHAMVEAAARKIFSQNVYVYANLEASQPVRVFVTGFVRNPGLYPGLSSDSVLSFIDRAGGIDEERGSYTSVKVLRQGQIRAQLDLYEFLTSGQQKLIQLHEGDTVLIAPRPAGAVVAGDVANSNFFELRRDPTLIGDLLALARPHPNSTHLTIVRRTGAQKQAIHLPLAQAGSQQVMPGDELLVSAEKAPATILVKIDGAHTGERVLALPYGSRLGQLLPTIKFTGNAHREAITLARKSVAARQKDMLLQSLSRIETLALTSRSRINEEAQLRQREAEMISRFVDKARQVEPKGLVVLADSAAEMALEDGDVVTIPERTSLVMTHGEVLFPVAVAYQPGLTAGDYVRMAGGFTQSADTSKVLRLQANGLVSESSLDQPLHAGDEVMVLPKVESKSMELVRAVSQVLYQIAISTRLVSGLF